MKPKYYNIKNANGDIFICVDCNMIVHSFCMSAKHGLYAAT